MNRTKADRANELPADAAIAEQLRPEHAEVYADADPAEATETGDSWWARATRIVTITAAAGLILSVGIGAVAGHRPMVQLAREARRTPVTVRIFWPEMPADIVKSARSQGVTGPITWMDPDSQRELTRLVENLVTDDPFDFDSLRAAQQGLMKTGWFSQPVRVTRMQSGLVEVQGQWRVPFGAVRVNGQDHIVTRKAELLSPQYHPDQSRLKVVIGANLSPPELGEPWIGGDVQAGLALLDYLRPMPGYEQVYAVDVSEYQTNKTLTILTPWQTRITWGGHPHEFNPGQAPSDTKRRRLADVMSKFGRLDAGRAQLDVRTEDGVYIIADAQTAMVEGQIPEQTAAR